MDHNKNSLNENSKFNKINIYQSEIEDLIENGLIENNLEINGNLSANNITTNHIIIRNTNMDIINIFRNTFSEYIVDNKIDFNYLLANVNLNELEFTDTIIKNSIIENCLLKNSDISLSKIDNQSIASILENINNTINQYKKDIKCLKNIINTQRIELNLIKEKLNITIT